MYALLQIRPETVNGEPGENNLTLVVTLEDINDNNPLFNKNEYIVHVPGDAQVDTVIANVRNVYIIILPCVSIEYLYTTSDRIVKITLVVRSNDWTYILFQANKYYHNYYIHVRDVAELVQHEFVSFSYHTYYISH